jgi:predicted RNase H-like HicB family nuclease
MPDEVVFEVHEAEEGGYYAAAIGYDIITQGDSWEELKLMAQDAVLCHFDDDATPGTFRLARAIGGVLITTDNRWHRLNNFTRQEPNHAADN